MLFCFYLNEKNNINFKVTLVLRFNQKILDQYLILHKILRIKFG